MVHFEISNIHNLHSQIYKISLLYTNSFYSYIAATEILISIASIGRISITGAYKMGCNLTTQSRMEIHFAPPCLPCKEGFING